MFIDNVWGMGTLTKVDEDKVLNLQARIAPLWQDPVLKQKSD